MPKLARDLGGVGPVIQVLTTEDRQFWKNCPIEVGAVLQLPTHRGEPPEVEDSNMAVFVHSLTEDESGLWLQVKFLGGAHPWSRDRGIKIFSRERRAIHVCLMGVTDCPVDAEKTWHVERFTVFPPGVPPPSYVEKAKRKDWKKLYTRSISLKQEETPEEGRRRPLPKRPRPPQTGPPGCPPCGLVCKLGQQRQRQRGVLRKLRARGPREKPAVR